MVILFDMVTQKAISLKIDEDLLYRLDELSSSIGCNRNKLINFAVSMLLENMSPLSFKNCLLTSIYCDAFRAF